MDDLVKALRSGEQADMDGTLVKVSRQACEEAADAIEALQAQLAEARDKALEEVLALLTQNDGAPCSPVHKWPDAEAERYYYGQVDAAASWAAAIRAMKGERG